MEWSFFSNHPDPPDSFNSTPTNRSGVFQGQITVNNFYNNVDGFDWIAAFDENLNCAGAQQLIMAGGQSFINLAIYGDDPLTPNEDEGMNPPEPFILAIYDASESAYIVYPEPFWGWYNNS